MTLYRVGSLSDIGYCRSVNEDSMFSGQRLFAVADGMGGHAAGDIASALVINRLSELEQCEVIEPTDIIAMIQKANQDVLNYGRNHPESWGLGTTISGICEVNVGGVRHWGVFNVGDSRVYRFWQGKLVRATTDHSEIAELIQQGCITEEEAKTHRLRNIITRSIGGTRLPQVDLFVIPQSSGERFLICTDGLTSELTDYQISSVLNSQPDPQLAVEQLVSEVLVAGARDNVTVIVFDVGEQINEVDESTNPRIDR